VTTIDSFTLPEARLYLSIFFLLLLHPTRTPILSPTHFILFLLYAPFFFLICRSNPQLCIKYCILPQTPFYGSTSLDTAHGVFRPFPFFGKESTYPQAPAFAAPRSLESRCAHISAWHRLPPRTVPPRSVGTCPSLRPPTTSSTTLFFSLYIVNVPCPLFLLAFFCYRLYL